MRITEKIKNKLKDNWNAPAVNIAFLGDSVTQGCFEVYYKNNGSLETIFDKNSAYHKYLAEIFAILYPNVPFNMINAGVSGSSAPHGLERLDRDVISHNPDLVVVCFGLNDSCFGLENISKYTDALDKIFTRLAEKDIEILFMTPNMMCTDVSCHISDERIRELAKGFIPTQTDGVLDKYIEAAKEVCRKHNIKVCDCYGKWKAMEAAGVEITELLSNKLNHPTREMNKLFAYSLAEAILTD